VSYQWNFGDGGTTSTSTGSATHTFTARGIYTITVQAIDDLGQAGSTSMQVNLTTGIAQGVNASFFFSPTNPAANNDVFFDASASSASNGATITNYRWDFGDGASEEGTSATTKHKFGLAATTYVVKLTVTDSQGRTASATQNVKTN
jgi:serine protease